MQKFLKPFIALFSLHGASAFVVIPKSSPWTVVTSPSSSSFGSETRQKMLPDSFLTDAIATASSTSSTLIISTIDSDIANIPDNEFATVFMGGIVVMMGGLISALIVGFMLESGDKYASVVAESYIQDIENDEQFWKGLSEEETKKIQAAMAKKNGKTNVQMAPMSDGDAVLAGASKNDKKDLDMFSDY